jgi:hypothetical protein
MHNMNKQQTVTETDVRTVMSSLLTDMRQKTQAHPKWVTWMDKGLEVGEWQY